MLRLGLVQMRCEKADITGNLSIMEGYIAEARLRHTDLVAFPEMCVTGYADPLRQPEVCLDAEGPEVARLLTMTQGFDGTILAGIIEASVRDKPFITQLVIRNGKMIGRYRKRTIAGDEADRFSPGHEPLVFVHDGITCGVSICADIDNRSVFADCAKLGATIVLECAAPGLYGEQATRNWQSGFEWWKGECLNKMAHHAATNNLWIGVSTQAGRTVDEDFPGGGYLFSATGENLYCASDYGEGVAWLEVDMDEHKVRCQNPASAR